MSVVVTSHIMTYHESLLEKSCIILVSDNSHDRLLSAVFCFTPKQDEMSSKSNFLVRTPSPVLDSFLELLTIM